MRNVHDWNLTAVSLREELVDLEFSPAHWMSPEPRLLLRLSGVYAFYCGDFLLGNIVQQLYLQPVTECDLREVGELFARSPKESYFSEENLVNQMNALGGMFVKIESSYGATVLALCRSADMTPTSDSVSA